MRVTEPDGFQRCAVQHLLRALLPLALLLVGGGAVQQAAASQTSQDALGTYAERLGWPEGSKVLIVHVDDAGMSYESNLGALRAMRDGVANSVSVMMPCPWTYHFAEIAAQNPGLDVGLHLTLTAEWDLYRWPALLGRETVPGLYDPEGALWANVRSVVAAASVDEVEAEVRAQIALAYAMGLHPTHVDSHMGTLFATPEFLERYVDIAIDLQIPAMLPGGHNELLLRQQHAGLAALPAEDRRAAEAALEERMARSRALGEKLWQGGLPVLDDLHNTSYEWKPEMSWDDDTLREFKVQRYVQAMAELRPGVTMMINHATDAGEHFLAISGSGPNRRGDLLALLDERVARAIEDHGIVLTTWRELGQRRRALEVKRAATGGAAR